MKAKALIIHYFYIVVRPVRKLYWQIFQPKTYGVKCLIKHKDVFLLIRNSYGHKRWTFPGGGVDREETPEDAVKREVLEEVGIELDVMEALGSYHSRREYKQDTVYCFYGEVSSDHFQKGFYEIEEARWMKFEEIPENKSFAIQEIFNLYFEKYGKP